MGTQRLVRTSCRAARSRCCLALGLAAACFVLAGCGSGRGSSTGSASSGERPGAPPPPARFVIGSWHGELHQRAVPRFQIVVTVGSLSSSAANRVRYTGINCGGHWTYLGTSGPTVRFREVIDSGRGGKCKGAGEVTLVREGARLLYRFSGGGVVSRGLLSRD